LLDVFGVHGIGGLTGTLLAGEWSAGMTFILLKLVSTFVPLRLSREHELEG
jgi:Amt family ammonium transporter